MAQVYKILDSQKTEVRFNSEWLGKMKSEDWVRLAAKYTVSQMLELYSVTRLNSTPSEARLPSDESSLGNALQPVGYWSLADPYLGGVWWIVDLGNGDWFQTSGAACDTALALGVHPGDLGVGVGAPVPVPSTLLLLGGGLAALLGLSTVARGPFRI